jgi:hypothetical protein
VFWLVWAPPADPAREVMAFIRPAGFNDDARRADLMASHDLWQPSGGDYGFVRDGSRLAEMGPKIFSDRGGLLPAAQTAAVMASAKSPGK